MNKLLSSERVTELQQQANEILSAYTNIHDPLERLLKIASDNQIGIYSGNLFEMSGALRKKDEKWSIFVNASDSQQRQLFTIAHELGHFFVHRDQCDEFVDGQLVSRTEQEKYGTLELEANEFAGNLIMPESEVRNRVATDAITLKTVKKLAEGFGVSTLAMTTRLKNLGYEPPSPPRAQAA